MKLTVRKRQIDLPKPLLYLITSGATTERTTPASEDFANLVGLVQAAVHARIDLIQIREKQLSARTLHYLAIRAVEITRGSVTRLLVNDRADIALASGADGVHLTSTSLDATVVRRTFGSDLLIGVSTHSLEEAAAARRGGADFAVFGPVFQTPGKPPPVGLDSLRAVCEELTPFPVIALGGIDAENAETAIAAGAAGVAGIRSFNDPRNLSLIVEKLKK